MHTDDIGLKLAVYRHFAQTGRAPSPAETAERIDGKVSDVLGGYARLSDQRVLVLEPDGGTIRMAPPFSGIPTQHVVTVGDQDYFANCAWDALAIPAALQLPGTVDSRCEQSREPLHLRVGTDGPESSDWLFHSLVAPPHWWDDIVFT